MRMMITNIKEFFRKSLFILLATTFICSYSMILCLYAVDNNKSLHASAKVYSDISPQTSWMPNYNEWIYDKIELSNAWSVTTGSSEILVGVVDTGIDATHKELQGYINTGLSKDFGDTNAPLVDSVGHGTAMASLIASNGKLINGICKNIQLVSLKIRDSNGNMFSHYIASAINYAAENNIKILNISAGNFINDAELREAVNNYPGLIVTSAGNEGKNLDGGYLSYLPSYTNENILVVGASTQSDSILTGSDASNYGINSVDLFAPGDGVYFAIPSNKYAMGYGSSASAAFVSGTAALILSVAPSMRTAQLKNSILNNVDKVDALSDKCVSGGRLNVYKSIVNREHECVRNFMYKISTPKSLYHHTAYCTVCGYCEDQAHNWVFVRGTYICICGQSTNYKPIIGFD